MSISQRRKPRRVIALYSTSEIGECSSCKGDEPIANVRTYGQGQGQWSYRKGSVSDDVIGKGRV